MVFGHNSNVRFGDTQFHVQTEDRGSHHPFIDTTVYSRGRVLHRRTTNYIDILEMDGDRDTALRNRVEVQHRAVIEEIRTGTLKLESTEPPKSPARAQGLRVTLLNPSSWLGAGKATLSVQVSGISTDAPLEGIEVEARIEGALTPASFTNVTDAAGRTEIAFAMPRFAPDGGALVIRASGAAGQDEVRYQLRAKPRTPAPADAR